MKAKDHPLFAGRLRDHVASLVGEAPSVLELDDHRSAESGRFLEHVDEVAALDQVSHVFKLDRRCPGAKPDPCMIGR